MSIGNSVKLARKANKIKQGKMARDIGLSQPMLSHIERGTKNPSIDSLTRISEYLNKPLPVLLWLGLEISDIPEDKQAIFKSIKPSFDELLKSVFEL